MLYLHIGTGKAGSTSIQKFLLQKRTELPHRQVEAFSLGNSWKLAAISGKNTTGKYFVETLKRISADEYDALPKTFWPAVAEEVEHLGDANFVASSEFIFGQYRDDRDAIGRLHSQLIRIFGDVKLLVYARNQIEFVKAFYAQRVKGPNRETMSYQEFISRLEDLLVPIDYAERLDAWRDVFGADSIEAVVFDRKNFKSGNLISDFCYRARMDVDLSGNGPAEKRSNVSPGFTYLMSRRRLNALQLGGLGEIADRALRRLPEISGYPPEFDKAILSKVTEGNARLNETLFRDQTVKLPTL